MNCPNCKKDLVPGYECEPCKAILNANIHERIVEVLNEPIVLPVEEVKEVKKLVKKKK